MARKTKIPKIPLSIYRIKDEVKNKLKDPIREMRLKEFVDYKERTEEKASNGEKGLIFKKDSDSGFKIRLFKLPASENIPRWNYFLKSGFDDYGEIENTVATGAVLLVELNKHGYAITFGTGRFLLDETKFEEKFGLITALNCCFPVITSDDDKYDLDRIKNIRAKTIAANPINTWKQSSIYSDFETFKVDKQHDLLQSITGIPVNSDHWGSCISGANTFRINISITFKGLEDTLDEIEKMYQRKDYQTSFPWVDGLIIEDEHDITNKLDEILFSKIKRGDIDDLNLAPPVMIDWDSFLYCKYNPFDSETEYEDILFSQYYDLLKKKINLIKINKEGFYTEIYEHKLVAIDVNNQLLGSWSILNCINCELEYDGKYFILNSGIYYQISKKYIDELNKYLVLLDESDISLVKANKKETEENYNNRAAKEYNKRAGKENSKLIVLDKKTIKIQTWTSPIEICDLFSNNGHFIHVKRKFQSSALSHLFNQGTVSGELFDKNKEFQIAVVDKLEKLEKKSGQFSSQIRIGNVKPEKFEVVYAIIGDWRGRRIEKALPFFSKVRLRQASIELQQRGFSVSYICIQTV